MVDNEFGIFVSLMNSGKGCDVVTVLNRGKTLGTAKRGEMTPEELQDLMAGGVELAELEGSQGGTV